MQEEKIAREGGPSPPCTPPAKPKGSPLGVWPDKKSAQPVKDVDLDQIDLDLEEKPESLSRQSTGLTEILFERGGEGPMPEPKEKQKKPKGKHKEETKKEEFALEEDSDVDEEEARLLTAVTHGFKHLKGGQEDSAPVSSKSEQRKRRCILVLTLVAYMAGFATMGLYAFLVMGFSPHLDAQHTIFPVLHPHLDNLLI